MRTITLRSLSDYYEETVVGTNYSVSAIMGTKEETKATVPEPSKSIADISESKAKSSLIKEVHKEERKSSEASPIQSNAEQSIAKENDRSIEIEMAFYDRYELFEDSKAMLCLACYKMKCKSCLANYHGGSRCDEKVRRRRIRARWKRVSNKLKLTGRVEEYLIACDTCGLNMFKDKNKSVISCKFCNKELKKS